MITDTENPSTADRMPASRAARSQRELDPALTVPMAATDIPVDTGIPVAAPESDIEGLAPLFQPLEAQGFRDAWVKVQAGFVDDPKEAVQHADQLVTQVMQSLGESFAGERTRLDSQAQTGQASTEDLRVVLRRYRSFLQRLLAF